MDPAFTAMIIRAPQAAGLECEIHPFTLVAGISTLKIDLFEFFRAGVVNGPVTQIAAVEGKYIRVFTPVDARCIFGTNGVRAATATDWPLMAGKVEQVFCTPENTGYMRVFSAVGGDGVWYIG